LIGPAQNNVIEKATGLVLRTRPLTETSLIVCWLTPTLGRLATVAKGARRSNSPFRGKLDLFYLADFTFSRSRRSELHTLREVGLLDPHGTLRRELGLLQQASYCAALVEQTTETETPLPEVFELLRGALDALGRQAPQPRTVLAFELKLLGVLGLAPDLAQARLSPGAQGLVKALAEEDWPAIALLKATAAQASELREFLKHFLIFNLPAVPRSRDAALELARPGIGATGPRSS
jgi:DNA repair protein RecO (recombination protein O)